MFKKTTAAIILSAVIMAGSSVSAFAETPVQTVVVEQEYAASAAKTWDGKAALKAGQKYVIKKNVTVSGKVTLPKGTTLTVKKGAKLTIGSKGALTVKGTLSVKSGATLAVSGTLTTAKGSKLIDAGTIKFAKTAKVTLGGKLTVSYISLLTISACVIIMIALTLFVSKSKMGKAMRACSEDKAAAQLMGINVNATISVTFAIGSALAAIAGVLLCSFNTSLMPTTGSMPGIKAFTAAVFGGIGSIPGAFLGGILLGIIENLSKAYISTQLSDAIVFLVLVVVLIVKPTGLLGKKVNVKV